MITADLQWHNNNIEEARRLVDLARQDGQTQHNDWVSLKADEIEGRLEKTDAT